MLGCILSVVGWFLLLRGGYALFRLVQELWFIRELDLRQRYGKGSYVLITAATDGIGLEFAVQFVKRGFNIVMVARNQSKMNEKEQLLKKINPEVNVIKLVMDFKNSPNYTLLDAIDEIIKIVDVSIVVNNIGLSTNNTPFYSMTMQDSLDMITANCIPQAILSKIFLKRFSERESRSALIDISSINSIQPFLGKEIYSATKIFNSWLSLAQSAKGPENVDFLCLKPGFVSTTGLRKRELNWTTCTTEECVEGTLKVLGQRAETYGSVKSILFGNVVHCLCMFIPIFKLTSLFGFAYKIIGFKPFDNDKKEQ